MFHNFQTTKVVEQSINQFKTQKERKKIIYFLPNETE